MEAAQKQAEHAGNRNDYKKRISYILISTSLLLLALIALRSVSIGYAQVTIFVFLGILATIGIFCIFAYLIGILRFSAVSAESGIAGFIVDNSDIGILVTNRDTHQIIFTSPAFLTMTGQNDSSGDLFGFERLFSKTPYASEAVYRLLQAAREGRSAVEEIRVTPALDRIHEHGWYRLTVHPQREKHNLLALWTLAEITCERERQENVFQELQVAIDYLDHAPVGFFSLLHDGSIAYMNITFANWLGYDIASVGSSAFSVKQIVSDDLAEIMTGLTGPAGENRTDIMDIDLIRRNGKPLPVRLYHNVSFDAAGKARLSRTIALNRQDIIDAAENDKDSATKYARLFNNSPMAIASIDAVGTIIQANTSFFRLFGSLSRLSSSLEGFPVKLVVAETERDVFAKALTSVLEGKGDIPPLELLSAGENGRALRIWLQPITEEPDQAEKALIYALDHSELRQIEEQLVQAQKMNAIGQLAGGVAHDFNNVLQAIIGYSDLLLGQHRPTDPSYQDIMQIKQNANRAAGLVRQLLAFSRRQTLLPQVLNLKDTLSDLSSMLRRVLGEKVGLELKHGRDLWPVRADGSQLGSVIINLAVNARDAMPGGGTLTIRTSNLGKEELHDCSVKDMPEGDYVMIEVSDTGHGIAPEIMEKIFEPFFTTKDIGKGTGLGLSMVFGFIKQSGGYIDVQSEVGKGTLFKICLPRYIASPVAATEEPEINSKQPEDMTGNAVILLVEDDEPVRAVNSRALSVRGYTVLQASSGAEALEIIDEEGDRIDLVISDVVMPEMDGPTLLRELRKRKPDLKMIFVSGYAEEAFKKNLPEGEEFNFLAKPFNLKKFVETVKGVIG